MCLNRLWFNLDGAGHTLGIHSPYTGAAYIDGIENDGAFTDISFVNYSGCVYDTGATGVTVTAASAADIAADASAYALALLPDSAYRSFALPKSYLGFTVAYTYVSGEGSGAFEGRNIFPDNTEVMVTVTVSGDGTAETKTAVTRFFSEAKSFAAYNLREYTQNVSMLIGTLIENGISLTVNLSSFGCGYVISIDAANRTVNGDAFSGNGYTLDTVCTVCRGSELYYSFGGETERRVMAYTDTNAPTTGEELAKCVYGMYFNADTTEMLSNDVLYTVTATANGRYFRIKADDDVIGTELYSTEFYTTEAVTGISYTAYIDIMSAYSELENDDWYRYLTNPALFRELTFFEYDAADGKFSLPSVTSTTDAHYVYMLEVSYTAEDGTPAAYRFWNNIQFPDGGLTGGTNQYSNITFNVPSYIIESETGEDGYIFSLSNEFCRIAPYISAVNGEAVLPGFSACSIVPVDEWGVGDITVRDGDTVSLVTAGRRYRIVINLSELSLTSDTSVTVAVPIYVRGEDDNGAGESEYRFLSEKLYTFTIPAIRTPADFAGLEGGTDNYSEDGLWVYLKVLEKLYTASAASGVAEPFDSSSGITVGGYIINSALSGITELDCTASGTASDAMNAAIAYFNSAFGQALTYAGIAPGGRVDARYLASFAGISYLNNLTRLTADSLALGNTDMSAVADCAELEYVSLKDSNLEFSADVKDIDFSGLGKLTELHIDGNNVSDVTGVLPVTTQILSLGNSTSASDLSLEGVAGLFALTELDASKPASNKNPGVRDYVPLMGLDRLQVLHLEGNAPDPDRAYRVIVHLYNHIRGISIYFRTQTNSFSVIADETEYTEASGSYSVDTYGLVNNSSAMDYGYYELYTSLNGIILMKKYESESRFGAEITAVADACGVSISYTVSAGYVTLTLTGDAGSVKGKFDIEIAAGGNG